MKWRSVLRSFYTVTCADCNKDRYGWQRCPCRTSGAGLPSLHLRKAAYKMEEARSELNEAMFLLTKMDTPDTTIRTIARIAVLSTEFVEIIKDAQKEVKP
jgi:hypothetical protein